ncbi:thioredoxin domain-containing protein [Dyadobacter subterraneus]|uniref:Thioredoxin fold domain-containing protein n=1 Tax=Dyadobacter subterraneus TaxID=2773304 RepID=A0ABR9WBE2_9BACT|nr:thioredoxin domain-containing protein [Dyadobacter subterraneus]MBE9462793.1 thioredoxin fold domain-containing protein [Dyadobacter subterraneus]
MKKLRLLSLALLALLLQTVAFAQTQPRKDLLTFEQFEAKLKAAGKDAQILDARLPEEYQQNHLEGAVSFNIANKADFDKESAKLNKDKPVFIYSIGNGRSSVLAKDLRGIGFKDVTEIPGGLSKWIGLGKPVISTVGKGLNREEYTASLKSDKLVLVDFGSRYCGSCKKLAPIVDSIKNEQASSLKVIKIEAYENKDLVKELGVVSLPTLVLYKNNEVIWKKTGVTPKKEIEKALAGQTL